MKKNRTFLFIICIYCMTITVAKAQLIFYDPITTSAGPLNVYNGWDNNSSNCASGGFCNALNPCVQLTNTPIAAPVSNYGNSTFSIASSFGTEGPGRCFTPVTLATSPNVYLAFLCTISSCPDNSGNLKGDIVRLIGSSAFNVVGRVNATGTAGKVAFRVGADANANLGSSATGTIFDFTGNTFLLILKFESIAGSANDVVKLFVFPTTTPFLSPLPTVEPTPYASTTFSAINPEPTSIKGFHLNTFLSQSTSGMPVCNLGAFKVTTSWASLMTRTGVVETAKTIANLTIFPQPVEDKATVEFTSTVANSGSINVLDASGRVVLTKNGVYTEGSNQITFSTENWASGLYLVRINNGLSAVTTKFIKE